MRKNFRKNSRKHLISSGPGYSIYKRPDSFIDKLNNYSITSIIIFINVILFFIVYFFNNSLINYVALNPSLVISGKYLWTFLTSMFMHGNFSHLFMNMLSLFFIGGFIETIIGKKRFLWFYLLSGIFSGIFFVVLSFFFGSNLNILAVGASGAIFGLGGLLAVLIPKLPVLVFFIIPMPMWVAMIFMLGILWIISWTGVPIGNLAHLGGLIIGVIYGFYLKNKYKNKTKMIQNYYS